MSSDQKFKQSAGETSAGRSDGPANFDGQRNYGTLSVFPAFSLTRYGRAKRAREGAQLPAGVVEPTTWIKNEGPLRVEPKVWLANERTYLKWQHICVLLAGFAVALWSAAYDNMVAQTMGVTYLVIALFAGGWGAYMHGVRRKMIIERSGKDFDNSVGPMVVSAALLLALLTNFFFQYQAAIDRLAGSSPPTPAA